MRRLTLARPPYAAGLAWVKDGWTLYRIAAIAWSGMTALVFMVLLGVAQIPYVGGLLIYVLTPFLVAGFFAGAQAGVDAKPVTFLALGAGFRAPRKGLLVIGLAYLLATLLIFKLVITLTGNNLQVILEQAQTPDKIDATTAQQLLHDVLPAIWLGLLLFTPLLMATWFSPALVLFEGFPPARAMWWSLWACAVNWRPLLHYSLIVGLIGVAAMFIPLGLGWLVFLPWALASTYISYRQIFVPIEDEAEEPAGVDGGV